VKQIALRTRNGWLAIHTSEKWKVKVIDEWVIQSKENWLGLKVV